MSLSSDCIKQWVKEGVKFIDFRFTDVVGGWHHITRYISSVNEDLLDKGIVFDGSSIMGWKAINNSDMILIPDLSTWFMDPFTTQETVVVICTVHDPIDASGYERDPRSVMLKCVEYMHSTGIADTMFLGAELEFFLFDDVRYGIGYNEGHFWVDCAELPSNCDRIYEHGNTGHRPSIKGGYLPVMPVDSLHELRSEILTVLSSIGLQPRVHHHEVASGQCEIGFEHSDILHAADNIQKAKYIVKAVADSCGKSATFMPKPVYGDNGSGMHCHQSLWKNGVNLFAGEGRELSENALYYIGGILKHGKALAAFTNASTNSYRRLVKGYEAPVNLVYSHSNRSAAIRIPHDPSNSSNAVRIELRFPDATANPYYAISAMAMAGLDGIVNKIHPTGLNVTGNLYEEEDSDSATLMSRSLDEALDCLDKDREFLEVGGVFTKDMLDKYIEIKREEAGDIWLHPQPAEFKKYYSC